MLEGAQVERYARHLLLAEVGRDGQERLLAASIRLPGVGRAAEEAAVYLVAAGVGRLVLDPPLADRLRIRLPDPNPDVTVAPDGEADWLLEASSPDTRLTGALAALTALVALSGAGPAPDSLPDDTEIRWQRS